MVSGVHLTLMVGPVVPVPVSQVVLNALTELQVNCSSGGTPSGFQLTFELSTNSPLHTLFLVSSGAPIPIIRVIIIVTMNGTSQVLIDGVMTRHQVDPGSKAGEAKLTVMGQDLSHVMDLPDFSGISYPAMPPVARVAMILAKYAVFGVIPKVIPSVMLDIPLPTGRIPRQQGSDLKYIKKLADDVGYVFYLEPGVTPGQSFAYWGPEIKVGVPQSSLNTNMDAETNVDNLSFSYEPQSRKLTILWLYQEKTGLAVPVAIPNIGPLNPPLGVIQPIPLKQHQIKDTAKFSATRGVMVGLAKTAQMAEVVEGSGTLKTQRYGRVLKARQLVGVRGAGVAFDGLYYVKSVNHTMKRGEYKQSFKLSRNGLISTVPVVPT